MFGSLKLGRVLGIDLFVHGTFWLLPALVLFGGVTSGRDVTLDLLLVFAMFGCIALHELGHAAAAAWYGIRTRDITLYPMGGVARLEGMPDRPLPEIVVALAGPAVNVAIAVALAGVLIAGGTVGGSAFLREPALGGFLVALLKTNVGLVVFNLIPAFPMDGGRVLRAGVQLFSDRVTATEVAAQVGAVCAGLMIVVGLFSDFAGPMLAVVGAFVFLMGRAELAQVRDRAWDERRRPRVVVAAPLDGWQWDADAGAWTEFRGGYPVRRWHPG
jgi:Zn-dependent protease